MTEIKSGDRVRVIIEGIHHGKPTAVGVHDDSRDFEIESGYGDTVTVEKIEPPETFGPGDGILRDKTNPDWMYVIDDKGGYTEIDTGRRYTAGHFTSEHYEKVALG